MSVRTPNMLLCELFDSGEMGNDLRQAALDYLTPFLAQKLPFVTINQIIEALQNQQFGIVVNRAMIMDILNPDEVQAVSKIEGDKIFLNGDEEDVPPSEGDAQNVEQDKQHVSDMAQNQAKKSITEPSPTL